MPVEIHVPELGESVAEATVQKWLKSEGEQVKAGEPVVELETDKINFEVEAEQDGVLQNIAVGEGEDVNVGDVIGMISEGEGAAPQEEAEQPQAREEKVAPEAQETEAEQSVIEETDGSREDGEVRASPSVRRLAREYDIDLADVPGSGSGGRVTKDDVERLIREQSRPAAAEQRSTPERDGLEEERPAAQEVLAPAAADRDEERVRMSRRRQTIAQRLVEAQQTAAMLTTFNEADLSAVMELRRRRKDAFQERHEVRLGYMSFFTKAAIGALKAFPKVNSELQGNELILKHFYDIGVAVNTEEGLVVPVVRDADKKSFAQIEQNIVELGRKAREGT
ncbi:MAG TPA: 2-oxo acid dehydrogenase subunit E2, partial [Rubrobacteraceae bacterium]|nr:2-oxo acid dehydrogenase subunit E2 [Rubrobacteraceae bacterium]